MQASQQFAASSMHLATMAPQRRAPGVKSSLARTVEALADFAEDIVILGQFAFGREYVALSGSGPKPSR